MEALSTLREFDCQRMSEGKFVREDVSQGESEVRRST